MISLSDFLEKEVSKLQDSNLFRDINNKVIKENEICFSGNDYLGLANGYGSTGSRLTTGTHQIHLDLEKLIAQWKHTEAAMVFSSGYMANLGTLSALLSIKDVIFTDEYAHACILDGIRLSKARKFIFRHNDTKDLERQIKKHRSKFDKAFIVTDSVFSMDGDKAPIAELVALSKRYTLSLYIDEAHGTGVFGRYGAGLVEEYIDKGEIQAGDVEVQMGTFSKALGLEGGYIAGSQELITFLQNKARTFIYSTAPSPLIMTEAFKRISQLRDGSLDNSRKILHNNIIYFRNKLKQAGIPYKNDGTSIFAVFVGDVDTTMRIAHGLRASQQIFVTPIRPPTVKEPRLRISISATHSQAQIDNLITTLLSCA